MSIEEIRRARLKMIIEAEGSNRRVADMLGVSDSQLSQWKNASEDGKGGKPRSISSATARKIEGAFKKPEGWMDQPIQQEDEMLSEDEAMMLELFRQFGPKHKAQIIENLSNAHAAAGGAIGGISPTGAASSKRARA